MTDIARKHVRVSVPCSTSNLGPGFDCLGLAFELRNEFSITVGEEGSGRHLTFEGPEKGNLRPTSGGMFFNAMDRLFQKVGTKIKDIQVVSTVNVPNARGLGSSSTAVAAAIFGANAILGEPLTIDQVLDLASEFEGHPDNASPALLGGLTASVIGNDSHVMYSRMMPSDKLCFVVLSPDYEVSTEDARNVLPKSLSLKDAVANSSRLPLLVDALQNGYGDRLKFLTQDRMHEPYRESLYKHIVSLRHCVYEAGAYSVTISGAGPSILAIAPNGDGDKIQSAWEQCLKDISLKGTVRQLKPATEGAKLITQ